MAFTAKPEVLSPRLKRGSRAFDDENLDLLSHVLDDFIKIPGTSIRFGLDGIVGFIPGIVGRMYQQFAITIAKSEQCQNDEFDELAGRDDPASVEPISNMPDQKSQGDHWQELTQSDQPERISASGLRVDQPANGHRRYLETKRRKNPRNPEERKTRMPEE